MEAAPFPEHGGENSDINQKFNKNIMFPLNNLFIRKPTFEWKVI